MRKFLTASIIAVLMFSTTASADVNPDTEIHRVMGGLYSLVSVIALNGQTAPDIRTLQGYFADVPGNWPETVRVERVNNELWAGVIVGKYSTARKYLRSNSPELGITDSPAGSAWMGGDYAWVKAANIDGGKLKPSALKAAQSEGAVFFSADGSNWWVSYPDLSRKSAQNIIKMWGVKQPGLHKPQGVVSESVYDSVKPSEVRKPADMHTNRNREFGESYDIDMGDVIFRPVPVPSYRN